MADRPGVTMGRISPITISAATSQNNGCLASSSQAIQMQQR